jgi:hypothetical protein
VHSYESGCTTLVGREVSAHAYPFLNMRFGLDYIFLLLDIAICYFYIEYVITYCYEKSKGFWEDGGAEPLTYEVLFSRLPAEY